ncbi:unnamed protein product [Sympodiomycopsis kandeliae]
MRIHRAHDGRTIEVKQALSQFAGLDDLLDAISLATGISTDNVICMSAEGLQLSDDLLASLTRDIDSAAQQVEFFVFNREYLYADVDQIVAQELAEEPSLSPAPAELALVQPPTPRSLEAILAWSHSVLEYIHSHASTSRNHHAALAVIQRSTSIALVNLLSHSSTVREGGTTAKTDSEVELTRMKTLLDTYQRHLEILGLVTINPRLLSASSSTNNKRTLGDFISRTRMSAVAEQCYNVYQDLRRRLDEMQAHADQLKADTDDLTLEVNSTSIQPSTDTLQEVTNAESEADDLAAFLSSSCSPDANGWPVADKLDGDAINRIHQSFEDLFHLDQLVRDSVRRLTADKNDMAARSLALLGDISSLQSDYAELAATLTAFRGELSSNRVDNFRHLARLNNMLWAYGATIVEIVRRKEFTKHYLAKSQALAELMAKVSSRERKRRNKFRTDVAGRLPWEVKGMDDAPPSLEISTSNRGSTNASSNGAAPDLDRADLDQMMELLAEVETTLAQADAISGDATSHVLKPVREGITQLIARIDDMDDEFALLVEDNLLDLREDEQGNSSNGGADDDHSQLSDGSQVRRRPRLRAIAARETNGKDAGAAETNHLLTVERENNARLQTELQHLMQQMEERERSDHTRFQTELTNVRTESSAARSESRKLKSELEAAQREATSAKTQLEALRSDVGTERERRINMQEELTLLRSEAQAARKGESEARREAAEEAERLVEVETHVHDLEAELEDAKAARVDASNRIENLLSEGSNVEKELSSAQERIEELLSHLETAKQEARNARDAHAESEAAQERTIRHYRVEADSDRAILEERLRERQVELEEAQMEIQRFKDSVRVDVEAVETLRSQLRGADEAHEELVKAMETAKDASAEAELSRRHAERETEMLLELTRPLLERMIAIKTHVQGLPALSSSRSASTGSNAPLTPGIAPIEEAITKSVGSVDVEDSAAYRQAAIDAFLASPSDSGIAATLDALRAFSPGQTCDETTKRLDLLVTLVRKWQKTYKRQTSDSASKINMAVRDRIAFRNFAIGDLALFLPSRNNALDPKPWAAFNISFPHYFLNVPSGSLLAEELRSKEWIVARITKIIERTAGSSQYDPQGNPFQLADGVKFCVLDVDGWSPNSPVNSRPRPSKHRSISASETPRREAPEKASDKQAGSTALPESPLNRRHTSNGVSQISKPLDTPIVAEMDDDDLLASKAKMLTEMNDSTGESKMEFDTADKAAESTAAVTVSNGARRSDILQESTQQGARLAGDSASSRASGLTKAIRAAASRSPPASRGFSQSNPSIKVDGPSLASLSAGGVGRSRNDQPHSAGSAQQSFASLESSAAAPAFGRIGGRRRGLKGLNAGLPASAATSPGATGFDRVLNTSEPSSVGVAFNSSNRMANLAYEAANPFSQSPGGPGFASSFAEAGSSLSNHRRSRLGMQNDVPKREVKEQSDASGQPKEGGVIQDEDDDGVPSPPNMSGPSRSAKTIRQTSKTVRSPSMASIAINSGSLTLSASPTAQAIAMAVPVQAEASLSQARGETTGGGDSLDSATSPQGTDVGTGEQQLQNGSGFSASSMSSSLRPPGAFVTTEQTITRPTVSPRSPSFLSRTFGRRTTTGQTGNGHAKNRSSVASLFGSQVDRVEEGKSIVKSTQEGPPLLAASASESLRKLSEPRRQ